MLNQKWKNWVIILSTATVLSACGSTHTVVKEDGTAGKLDWPNPASVSMDQNRGIFPDLDNLKQIRSGMSREQLYALIGRPHFSEGFRVREWDYLFYFNTPNQGANGVTTCQYKILFDNKKFARSFHWRAIDPENAVCPPLQKKLEPNIITR